MQTSPSFSLNFHIQSCLILGRSDKKGWTCKKNTRQSFFCSFTNNITISFHSTPFACFTFYFLIVFRYFFSFSVLSEVKKIFHFCVLFSHRFGNFFQCGLCLLMASNERHFTLELFKWKTVKVPSEFSLTIAEVKENKNRLTTQREKRGERNCQFRFRCHLCQ